MGFTTLLVTVSMVTIANAGFPGWPNNDNAFSGFPSPMMPSLRFGPPSMPGMPNFGQNFPFYQFPAFPAITFPSMPSPSDIAKVKPGKGGTFTGVMISSKTEAKRKEDGTIVKESGSTILMNNDGVVTVKKTGNAPDIETKYAADVETDAPPTSRSMFAKPKITPPKFQFSNFGFRSIIDPKKIETYVPGPDGTFRAHSIRSRSFSSNDNGRISQGGRIDTVVNENGRVNKQHYCYGTPPC